MSLLRNSEAMFHKSLERAAAKELEGQDAQHHMRRRLVATGGDDVGFIRCVAHGFAFRIESKMAARRWLPAASQAARAMS